MNLIAEVVELFYRAICHHWTYTPEQVGSAWLTVLYVTPTSNSVRFSYADPGIPIGELDLSFATTLSAVFPLPR